MTKHLQQLIDAKLNIEFFAYRHNDIVRLQNSCNQNDYKKIDICNLQDTELTKKEKAVVEIFKKNPARQVVIMSRIPIVEKFAKTSKSILPILDDMAQVVGISLKYTNRYNYYKLLKWRNCLILEYGTLLAVGRTIEEAIVVTQVAEKAVYCFQESKKLGGAKPINFIRSAIMFVVYKNKYSKENIKRQKERMTN